MTRARDIADTQDNVGGAVAPYVAGKNYIINGGFDIWQRGTSFTNPGASYTADRWQAYFPAAGTITQETTIVPTGFRYAARLTSTATSGSNDIYQIIETNNVIPLVGKTVTVSAYVTSSVVGRTPTLNFTYSTTVDDSLFNIGLTIGNASVTITTVGVFQRVTLTATIPSSAKTIRLGLTSGGINNGEYLIWGGAQLELGSAATPFARAGSTMGGELALCQRYYYRQTGSADGGYGTGFAVATGIAMFNWQLPVTMRTAPTAIEVPSTITNLKLTNWTTTNYTIATLTIGSGTGSTTNSVILRVDTSGLTVNQGVLLVNNATASGFLGVSAEL